MAGKYGDDLADLFEAQARRIAELERLAGISPNAVFNAPLPATLRENLNQLWDNEQFYRSWLRETGAANPTFDKARIIDAIIENLQVFSSPTNVNFIVLSSSRTINGEELSAGDILMGDNSDGKANILWDQSAGVLYFRLGTIVQNFMSSTAVAAVGAKVYRENAQSFSSGTFQPVEWEAEAYDDADFVDLGTFDTRITIPTGYGGRYEMFAAAGFDANATGYRQLSIRVNGTSRVTELVDATGQTVSMKAFTETVLEDGDYVTLAAFQNSGGNLNLGGAPAVDEYPFLYIRKVR